MRSFSFTFPANTNTQNLWTLIQAAANATPSGTILPDRCKFLFISCIPGAGDTVQIVDSVGNGGVTFVPSGLANLSIFSDRNSIELNDYNFKPSANSQTLSVLIEYN
jgi:hypothetical protein